MTVEIEFYPNKRLMQRGKVQRHLNLWRPLHTDFIGNKIRVTYVNDLDNPDQPNPEQDARRELTDLLLGKLKNNTITFEQFKTLSRLEHGYTLTQTTRDKILVAIQGVVGSLRDRIKSAFNL